MTCLLLVLCRCCLRYGLPGLSCQERTRSCFFTKTRGFRSWLDTRSKDEKERKSVIARQTKLVIEKERKSFRSHFRKKNITGREWTDGHTVCTRLAKKVVGRDQKLRHEIICSFLMSLPSSLPSFQNNLSFCCKRSHEETSWETKLWKLQQELRGPKKRVERKQPPPQLSSLTSQCRWWWCLRWLSIPSPQSSHSQSKPTTDTEEGHAG